MTKQQAKELLELFYEVKLPVVDQIIATKQGDNEINNYTFKYLICIAYDLKEKE